MLNIFDLIDLHAIFVNIRNDPSNIYNSKILEAILPTINDTSHIKGNSLREAIVGFCPVLSPDYSFVYTNNVYSGIPFLLRNEKKKELLFYSVSYLLTVLTEKNEERIGDTADALHNLPLILMDTKNWRSFWRTVVVPYQKKWDKSFLKDFRKRIC